jgi:hypothetical protein
MFFVATSENENVNNLSNIVVLINVVSGHNVVGFARLILVSEHDVSVSISGTNHSRRVWQHG